MWHAPRPRFSTRTALLCAALAFTLLATACSGSDSTTASESDTPAATTAADSSDVSTEGSESSDSDDVGEGATPTNEAATSGLAPDTESDPDAPDAEPDETIDADSDDANDTSSESGDTTDAPQPVEPDPIGGDPRDALAQILPLFGITDTDAAIECIEREAEKDGIPLDKVTAGAGNAMMIAAVRCDPNAMREGFSQSFAEIDTSQMASTPAQLDCGLETLFGWFQTVPLTEADAVFEGDAPQEVLDLLVDTCDMSESDADFFLNDA